MASVEPLISTAMLGITAFLRPWFFAICASLALFGSAQEALAPTGKAAEVLTASQGVYPEVFANDTIRKIGSFLFNTRTRKAYRFTADEREKDQRVCGGIGTPMTLEREMLDLRTGRWLSLDPLTIQYPGLSPYQFAGNNPILNIDPDGKRIWPTNQEAKEALIGVLNSFAPEEKVGEIFHLHVDKTTGVFYSDDQAAISKKEFNKRLRQSDVKLGREARKSAYSTYLAIASSDEIQVEVYHAASGENTVLDANGEDGTRIKGELNKMNGNIGLNKMKEDILAHGSATTAILDEAIRPDAGAGTGKYKPDAVGDNYAVFNAAQEDSQNQVSKTIVIDGSGKSSKQNAATLQKALTNGN